VVLVLAVSSDKSGTGAGTKISRIHLDTRVVYRVGRHDHDPRYMPRYPVAVPVLK
jgi:hypothetical protein